MKTRHKLMIAAAAVGLPVGLWAATVEFRDFSDAGASIHVSGQMPGTVARLERSTDLVNWAPVDAETVAPDGTALLAYANLPGQPRGFYRVSAEPAPRPGSVVQMQCSQDQVARELTGPFPFDYSFPAPLITQGAAYPQLDTVITPTRAGNKLLVEAVVQCSVHYPHSGSKIYAALFQDAQPEALGAAGFGGYGNPTGIVTVRQVLTATGTTPVTIRVRMSVDAQPVALNVNVCGDLIPSVHKLTSTLTVTEIQQ
jgi:hypothetical protein